MKTKTRTKLVPGAILPEVPLAIAEKILRDIARRNGEWIKKRRSSTMKEHYGDGYMVIDPQTNCLLSPGGLDGFEMTLGDLAERYGGDRKNTTWQRTVIKAVMAGKVRDTA
jgi:hypothetical protein